MIPSRRALVLALFLAAFATLWSRRAAAFCGFYVSGADAKLFANATQVVLMREGTRTVLSMQNDYQGPPEAFAMVVPVPVVLQKENVKTLPKEVFARIDKLDAPRLVEYWEKDPCEPEVDHARRRFSPSRGGGAAPAAAAPSKDLGVTIEAQFTVGEYEIVILGAKDSAGLDTWLKREGYKIPEGSEPFLRPYVRDGSKFFVAKVDVSKVKVEGTRTTLSPLRFHYDATTFSLPIRLGLVNSPGTQDLIVHVLGKGKRYEVANYPNVTIPTNLDVAEAAKEKFGTFYAALFDKTLAKTPRAVVTEYAWDAGSCDPCPEPPLTDTELVTFGADVLPSVSSEADLVDPALLKALGADAGKKGSRPVPPRRRYYGLGSSFVLTRLHARYTRDALGDDLVLKEASPIAGGREVRSADGTLESRSQPSASSTFQGRYAVRHPWSGPIACANPIRNRWGGPPNGITNGPAKPALGLAYAARDNVQFASFLRTDVSELGVKAEGEIPSPVGTYVRPESAPTSVTSAPTATEGDAGAAPAASGSKGCAGCAAAPSRWGSGAVAAFLLALGLVVARRSGRGS
ncbi:MAG: DUF2330 domain-containing protein [Deltaproteobacteria bacterium]|nr:DUF2330 domain-containing protein [Deltaproteobacteria bacterium]